MRLWWLNIWLLYFCLLALSPAGVSLWSERECEPVVILPPGAGALTLCAIDIKRTDTRSQRGVMVGRGRGVYMQSISFLSTEVQITKIVWVKGDDRKRSRDIYWHPFTASPVFKGKINIKHVGRFIYRGCLPQSHALQPWMQSSNSCGVFFLNEYFRPRRLRLLFI